MKLTNSQTKRLRADPARAGWVQVGMAVLGIGLSYIAGMLLKKKSKSPIEDDQPTTLSTRGSYMAWFVGIREVGPVFCWAGDREINQEEVEGGKGGGAPEQDVFYEAGWHMIGVGPVYALREIKQGGIAIFTGPITSESHPSGTTVDLGKEGSFRIFWGEDTQPINTFLGDPSRVGISSRWPFGCYIEWNKKRMGTSPTWPLLTYVMERRPVGAHLSQSDAWYEPGLTLSGDVYDIDDFLADADEEVGYLQFQNDLSHVFKPLTLIALVGNGLPDGDYEVLSSETVLITTGTTSGGFAVQNTVTRVHLQGGTVGADAAGTAEPYEADLTDGANIAHVIAELAFQQFPLGLAQDPNGIELWSLESLEALGVEAETELWRASVLGSEGETAEALMAGMLQDHGTMLTIDAANTGAMLFQRVREPSGTLPNLGDTIFAEKLPEIETLHGEFPVDKLIFSFIDREHAFGEMTVAIDDDGQASYLEQQRARKVPIISTVNFDTAAQLAELRSPEELAHTAEFRFDASREARELLPGDAIIADTFEEVLRVTSVDVDPLSERVTLNVLPDFYGAKKTDFVNEQGGGTVVPAAPEQDLAFAWVEVPEQVLGGLGADDQTILVPRIRAHELITGASIWLSRDNSAYTLWGSDSLTQTGGILLDTLSADGPTYVALGPEYTELGPDNGTLTQDLSGDLTNWGLGRQLCVLVTDGLAEICFLQKATITGASTRRLDGLLRARYDTRKLDHDATTQVFIFDMDVISPIQDILLEPDVALYVKTQPKTISGQVNLSAVPPFGEQLTGKGVVPIRPDYVHVRAPFLNSPAFQTGDNITISWALSSGTPNTGCGGQSAGVAIGAADIPGTVLIELLTTSDVLELQTSVSAEDTSYTIINADLVAAFSGVEPAAFHVRVSHQANGFTSELSPTLTITRVA